MAMENKRIIQLNTERTTPTSGDYVMVDSATDGTAKYQLSKITDGLTQEIATRTAADTAINTEVTQLKEDFDYYKIANSPYIVDTTETLGYIDISGNIQDATQNNREVYTDYIPVDSGEWLSFYCYNSRGTNYPLWGKLALYDSSKTFVRREDLFYETSVSVNASWENKDDDVKYIRLTYRTGTIEIGQYVFAYITRLVQKTSDTKTKELEDVIQSISGNTKNLFSGDFVTGFIFSNSGQSSINSNENAVTVYAACDGGKTYTVSKKAGARFSVGTTTSIPSVGVTVSDYSVDNTANSITITASATAKYICAFVYLSTADSIDKTEMLSSVQIEEGAVATKYMQHKTATDVEVREYVKGFSVAQNYDALLYTITPSVYVINDDGEYGNGGNCLFTVRSGETTPGYTRKDGSVIFPIANQGAIPPSNAPYTDLINVIKSYVGNESLVYGNAETMYSTTCSNQIDCSTFVTAVLNRVTYDKSRYVQDTNLLGASIGDTLFHYSPTIGWTRLFTWLMAQWFAERKRLFVLPETDMEACNELQFGDILFSSSGGYGERYYGIDHVLFVLGTIPSAGVAIVAQAGSAVDPVANNNTTVCKTSIVRLDSSTIGTTYKVFARPNYGASNIEDTELSFMRASIDSSYTINAKLLIDYYVRPTEGTITYSPTYCGTPDKIYVLPGKTIRYTGEIKDDEEVAYSAYCIEYDSNDSFVKYTNLTRGNATIGDTTKYVKFTFGYAQSLNKMPSLSTIDDFSVVIE